MNVDAVVDRFYELLTTGFERYVPIKRKSLVDRPPWYNGTLSNLKNRKDRAHKSYKSSYIKFCSLSNEFHSAQLRTYQFYLDQTQANLVSDPSKFWMYVDEMRKTSGYLSLIYRGGVRTTDMQRKCELFAEFFRDVFVEDPGLDDQTFELSKCVDIGSLELSASQVLDALNGIDTSNGNGPDGISPLLLKNCSNVLCAPLLRIFNLSLNGRFPSRWKDSYVVPIFKNGSRSNVESYQGIAILPTFGKLFESMVCNILSEKFKDVVSLSQHGFVKGRSISTNLLEFVSESVRLNESGHQIDVVYTNVRKAFDRVLHSTLLCKLSELGVHSSALRWIQSYLSGRTQYVNLVGWK